MKQLKLMIALLLATVCWQPAMAEEFVIDGLRYEKWLYYDKVTVYGTAETSGDIVVPSSVEYHDVVYPVGGARFGNCDNITSLVLPSSVQSVNISYCANLKSVDMSTTYLSDWYESNFSSCPKLETILMPDVYWPSYLTSFGDYCFSNCAIKGFVVPYGVEKLQNAFMGCDLDYLVLPSTVKEIVGMLGGNIKKLICLGSKIPAFTPDPTNGFQYTVYCDSLLVHNVTFTDYYGDWKDYLQTPNGIGYVKDVEQAQLDVSELTLKMGESRQLSFTMTPNDATIKDYRFRVDGAAATVTQDGKVTGIKPGKSTISLYWLDYLGQFSQYTTCEVTVLNDGTVATDSVDVVIGELKYRLYQPTNTATVISNNKSYSGDIVIPSTVTYDGTAYKVNVIGEGAFQSCEDLTSVVIPSSISQLGKDCFAGCTNLMSVSLPEGLTIIPEGCFNCCSSLENIVIPESVTKLKPSAFAACPIDSIILPRNITSVGRRCFDSCKKLTKVTCLATTVPWAHTEWRISTGDITLYVPRSALDDYKATSPWSACFKILPLGTQVMATIDGVNYVLDLETQTATVSNNDTRLSHDINIPSTVTYEGSDYKVTAIDDKAFMNTHIPSITIGSGITVGDSCFVGCSSLKSANLPDDLTSIPDYCFYKCSALTSVHFPTMLSKLGEKAFGQCSALPKVILPANVTTIGTHCFILCKNLKTMTCLAATPPTMPTGTLPSDTLYVYEPSLGAYKAASPWAGISTIRPIITAITLPTSAAVEPQKTISLEASLQPGSATMDELTWSSSDERIAKVDADGIVTGISLGTTTITATSKDGLGSTASCQVIVTNDVSGIETVNAAEAEGSAYYTLEGIKLQAKPQREGIYIRVKNGKSQKVTVRR